jgi:hypothetical protein
VEEERGTGVEEERDAGVEAHVKDAEEGARWRADAEEERVPAGVGEMIGLGFGGSYALKKKNSSDAC